MNNPYAALYRQSPIRCGTVVKVCAFFTNDAYRREADQLLDSLDRFSLYYSIHRIDGRDGWTEAVLHKPRFILDSLRDTDADAILYTDADSELLQKPDWSIFKDADVSWHQFRSSPIHAEENLTGTMFFRNTPDVRLFVEEWAKETELPAYRNHFTPEQQSLRVTFTLKPSAGDLWARRLRFVSMPPEWCWFDTCREIYGEKNPIILHRQASRKYRHKEQAQGTA